VSVNTPDIQGFLRATPSYTLSFPEDHGDHPAYQTEWWYYTGNLFTNDGYRFAYQLTFFRRSIVPPTQIPEPSSSWRTGQAYMAHFALTDSSRGNHHSYEMIARGTIDLAGAHYKPFEVWLHDWKVIEFAPDQYRLNASQDNVAIDLLLYDQKGIVLHGENGYSQKGPNPGNASHYYSFSRLNTNGTITMGKDTHTVSGTSWMDHEFSTSALSNNQIGWDWFSIQLEDMTEVMVFQLRRADGSVDVYSSGTAIDAEGKTRYLYYNDFDITIKDTWISPKTAAEYPSGWIIRIPSEDLIIEVQPILQDQELNHSYTYWEGAVDIQAKRDGNEVSGYGFVEMTGYAESFEGEF